MDKDTVILELEDKVRELETADGNSFYHGSELAEYKEKYNYLEEKY